jgi:paraquat-inducible protein B
MFRKLSVLLILSFVFFGFKATGLNLTIRFSKIDGLKESDRVLFEQNHIGNVTRVFYTKDGKFLVDVTIKKTFTNAATQHSKFFITADPQHKAKKAVKILQLKDKGEALKEGATIDGSSEYSALLDQIMDDLGKKLEDLKKQFEKFPDKMKKIPESNEYKKLKKELERLAEKIKQVEEAAQEKIQKEILPRLKQEMENLKERFRKFQQKEEPKPLGV